MRESTLQPVTTASDSDSQCPAIPPRDATAISSLTSLGYRIPHTQRSQHLAAPFRDRRNESSDPSKPDTSRAPCPPSAPRRPGCASSMRAPDRLARDPARPRAAYRSAAGPTSASFMMSSGSSERGLSDVSTTKSLSSRRRHPHQRTLGAVAVAAAAEQRDHAAPASARAPPESRCAARRRCARSPPPPETAARVDALEPSGNRAARRDAAGDGRQVHAVTQPAPAAARMFSTLIRPTSADSTGWRAP